MNHTIPDEYIFNSALYQDIENKAHDAFGVISSETLARTIMTLQASEQNSIVVDLYGQILHKLTPENLQRSNIA
ncbi:hypothetical protein [uncultured Pluralibacter sp.]|uniref:hypothetical protein n=1 Tax=uncultured Pluralibacter sp. TaxID=1490864 RepID=UPI0026222521|nr:hypothetical protein [uncultured Pluralibacter sp.]